MVLLALWLPLDAGVEFKTDLVPIMLRDVSFRVPSLVLFNNVNRAPPKIPTNLRVRSIMYVYEIMKYSINPIIF